MAEALDAAATVGDSPVDIEAQIKDAMIARTPYFEKQADLLTFEGVRRLIEKDLGMEKHALDVHKRLIKNCLLECLDGSETADASNSAKKVQQNIVTSDKGDPVESAEGVESKKETVESVSENEDKMEDSPVMGLLTTQKVTKADKGSEGNGHKGDITESIILKAIKKRAAYFKSNAEKVTMAGVRRLLEEDLKLEKRSLDLFKQFIGNELEKVLETREVSKSAKSTKDKTVKKLPKTKASEVSDESGGDSSASEEEVKPRKKTAAKGRSATNAVKKRKTPPAKEVKTPSKRIKPEKATSNCSEHKEDREQESGDESQSSGEKHPKRKEVSAAPVYGKNVERLKSIIKACGMGVPPSIYKKVKQGPEDKREARLIKELEELLSKEGLSANPSEKEIKDVKRKKERARELEGIDTSNIVSSSRRRSTSSYVPPPKPQIAVESEGEESEESEEDEEDEEDDENKDDDADNNDESQGEDPSEGDEDSD